MSAGRHALAWLVVANAVGLWLSLLLLFPEWQAGEWTYGRWLPVHLNGMLYGWTAMPLVAWLLILYRVPRRWADVASLAWTMALVAGSASWLSGYSSGKVFLEWNRGPLVSIMVAMGLLWGLLGIAWWQLRETLPTPRHLGLGAGLAVLALIPFGLWQATSAEVYPPVNPTSGGPTGASLLGSTLIVVVLLLLLPRCRGLRSSYNSRPRRSLVYLGLSAIVCAVAEARGGDHHDPVQIIALAMLLPWPMVIVRDWRAFQWPEDSHRWRSAVFFWWGLLVTSGFIFFLPGVLDRMKFTNGLVGHSHLAMAGFTTSFCALLLRLLGQRFGGAATFWAWHVAATAMVFTLVVAGWAEGGNPSWMSDNPWWRTAALAIRTACGAIMLAAAIHWLLSWRPTRHTLTNHETPCLPMEPGFRRDGCADRPTTGYLSQPSDSDAQHSGERSARLSELGWGVRELRGLFLRAGAARKHRRRNGVDLHCPSEGRGLVVSGDQDFTAFDAGPMAECGRGGCVSGSSPMHGPKQGLVAGPNGLMVPLRGAGVIAMVYAHFLIFAQFAWIELMRLSGVTPMFEKLALGTMAVGGIVSGFVVARRGVSTGMLRCSFIVAGLAAACATSASGPAAFVAVSLVTGASIGVMTVSLACLLPRWCKLPWIGLGTGMGYSLCNFPVIFTASPAQQAVAGALFALGGALLIPRSAEGTNSMTSQSSSPGAVAAIAAFTALVWMDSAAFFIIQHSEDLRTATWGHGLLWRNAVLHLGAALIAGWALRHGIKGLLVASSLILAVAAMAVNEPGTRMMAGWWYPIGVSLYSTALVAWPAYFSQDGAPRRIARRAAWLYAVAGWFGSANGIGMVQCLKRVPAGFVIGAGTLVAIAILTRQSRWRAAIVGLAITWIGVNSNASPLSQSNPVLRGRSVYISEGCINCHSRYVRPGSRDEIDWGPMECLPDVLNEKPVMIGNRRQGPDLSNVGLRRSATWLRLHFLDPRSLSPRSAMPSYGYLFSDGRGEDLIAFLRDVRPEAWHERQIAIDSWSVPAAAPQENAVELYSNHCAMCHGSDGSGSGSLSAALPKKPTNLGKGPFVWTPTGADLEARLFKVIKFGVLGSDMPGHELLKDEEIAGLSRYLKDLRDTVGRNHSVDG